MLTEKEYKGYTVTFYELLKRIRIIRSHLNELEMDLEELLEDAKSQDEV